LGPVPIDPGFQYGIQGKSARKRPFSGVPQDPGKGVFFGLCLGSSKPPVAYGLNPLKVSIETFKGAKKKK